MRSFLAIGSNLGDRWAHLRRAMGDLPDLVARSAVYETDAVGGPSGQRPYLNMVAELETGLSPRDLLGLCQGLEREAGRVRGERWGPRTLDVDVLLAGDAVVDEPDLQVPHPRMWERGFVVVPLRELAPELVEAHAGGTGGAAPWADLYPGVRRAGTI